MNLITVSFFLFNSFSMPLGLDLEQLANKANKAIRTFLFYFFNTLSIYAWFKIQTNTILLRELTTVESLSIILFAIGLIHAMENIIKPKVEQLLQLAAKGICDGIKYVLDVATFPIQAVQLLQAMKF